MKTFLTVLAAAFICANAQALTYIHTSVVYSANGRGFIVVVPPSATETRQAFGYFVKDDGFVQPLWRVHDWKDASQLSISGDGKYVVSLAPERGRHFENGTPILSVFKNGQEVAVYTDAELWAGMPQMYLWDESSKVLFMGNYATIRRQNGPWVEFSLEKKQFKLRPTSRSNSSPSNQPQ